MDRIDIDEYKRIKEEYDNAQSMLQEEIKNLSGDEKHQKIIDFATKYKEIFKKLNSFQKEKDEEILGIIDMIKEKYNAKTGGDARYAFSERGCYYLPIMLKRILPEEDVKIYTSTVGEESHAISKIDKSYYDINGNVLSSNQNNQDYFDEKVIDISNYKEASDDDYNYFVDLCYMGRNKDFINQFESVCDEITDEIIQELNKENIKNSKIA